MRPAHANCSKETTYGCHLLKSMLAARAAETSLCSSEDMPDLQTDVQDQTRRCQVLFGRMQAKGIPGAQRAYNCCMTTIATIRRNALRSLVPPPRLRLIEWIEANILRP